MVSVSDYFLWHEKGFQLLVASFGASAVLIYGAPESRLAQPRNLIGKHLANLHAAANSSHKKQQLVAGRHSLLRQ